VRAIHARENSSQELKLIPTIPSKGTKLEPQTFAHEHPGGCILNIDGPATHREREALVAIHGTCTLVCCQGVKIRPEIIMIT